MPLRQETGSRPRAVALPLFRRQCAKSRREPLHGPVTVAVPPGSVAAAALSVVTMVCMALAAWLVEVPQRTRAVGVLMPPDGFVRIVAPQRGWVTDVSVRDGEDVETGQALLRVTASNEVATASDSAPQARLRSLQSEMALRRSFERGETRARTRRGLAIDEQLHRLDDEVARAKRQISLHDSRVKLLAGRVERLQSLAADHNVSGADVEEARLSLLAARATAESLRGRTSEIERQQGALAAERASLEDESGLRQIEQQIALEQIERQLPDLETQLGRALRAPREGVVARVMVRPGQPVQAGQTLATLFRGASRLEAWLYVSSADGAFLHEGQAVELSFDAWPSEMFGTRSAVVTSVSLTAVMPSELDVPLALSGPVFEIRATLRRQSITAHGREWPLVAGTVVHADLVQQRYRLYEWLLRLQPGRRDAADSPADA